MTISGLWHGASWTFVFWGMLHGFAQIIHRFYATKISRKGKASKEKEIKLGTKMIPVLLTFIFVSFSWIFFRADKFETAFIIIKRIIQLETGVVYIYVYFLILGVFVFLAHIYSLLKNHGNGFYPLLKLATFRSKLALSIIIWIIIAFSYVGDTAFIYQKF
jgi:alginate O-acetyltransferase complex protein AlgI